MKKWIILTLTLLCLLAASSALGETATGGPCYNGHTWGEWIVDWDASCGYDGWQTRWCQICQASESQSIPATGNHTWGDWYYYYDSDQPSCTEEGQLTRWCMVCQDMQTQSVPALGHDWGDWGPSPAAMPPTCTEWGVEFRSCARCGLWESRDSAPLGHDPVTEPGYPASCEQEGLTDGLRCSRCGILLSEQEPIPPLGHDWSKSEVTKPVTCEEDGEITYYCYRPQTHAHTKTEIIPAPGHDWGPWITDGEPSCSSNGKQHRVCSRCEKEDFAPIPALGHQITAMQDIEATCTQEGRQGGEQCTVCGEVITAPTIIPAKGHTLVQLPEKEATCMEAGLTPGLRCSDCGAVLREQTVIPALDHDWSAWRLTPAAAAEDKRTEERSCSRCGAIQQREIAYNPPILSGSYVDQIYRPGDRAYMTITLENTDPQDTIHVTRFDYYSSKTESGYPETTPPDLTGYFDITLGPGETYTDSRYFFGVDQEEALKGTVYVNFHMICDSALHDWDYDCLWNCAIHMEPDDVSAVKVSEGQYVQYKQNMDGTWQYLSNIDTTAYVSSVTAYPMKPLSGLLEDLCTAVSSGGHVWDEGKLTLQPGLLHNGENTFTCTQCQTTRVESIPAAGLSFPPGGFTSMLFNLGSDEEESDMPLTIVTQPQPGAVFRNTPSSHHMYIEVKGGNPPYQYQWYGANRSNRKTHIASKQGSGRTGLRFTKMDYGNDASYDADRGRYSYYCKVTDAAGSIVNSDHVIVDYRPYFLKEPADINLKSSGKSSQTLWVDVEDGAEPYTYQWYRIDENTGHAVAVDGATASSFDPGGREGRYYCEVTDAKGYSSQSRTARVYSADPLSLNGPYDAEWAGKPVTLAATIYGGVPPFEIKWYDAYNQELSSESRIDRRTEFQVSDLRRFSVTVKDDLGDIVSGYADVMMKPLTIVRQPEGGEAAFDQYVTLSVIVSDGKSPYTYVLEKDGEAIQTQFSNNSYYDFKVNEAGLYCIYVYDANDRFAQTIDAKVTRQEFKLASFSRQANITIPKGTASLWVKAVGGKKPYTYQWERYDSQTKKYVKVGENKLSLIVREPKTSFRCTVIDSNGETRVAYPMNVNYTGQPWITLQPKDVELKYNDEQYYSATFTCDAICASNSGNVVYTWQRRNTRGWEDVGTGKKLTVQEFYSSDLNKALCNTYRCVVLDKGNNMSSISNEVHVSMPMKLNAYYTSLKKFGHGVYFLEITGGQAPYDVVLNKIIARTAKDGKKTSTAYFMDYRCEDFTIEQGNHWLKLTVDDLYAVFEFYNNGTAYSQSYSFTVTDGQGLRNTVVPYIR